MFVVCIENATIALDLDRTREGERKKKIIRTKLLRTE